MDERAKRLAEVILKYSVEVKPGDIVYVGGGEAAIPFIKELCNQAIDLGANAVPQISLTDVEEYRVKHGNDEQIAFLPPDLLETIKKADVLITVLGSKNTRGYANVDAEKMKLKSKGRGSVGELYMERRAKKELRWCGTLYPVDADAQEANMSLAEYEDFVYSAGLVHQEGAVEKWLEIKKEQDRICEILDTKKNIRIVAKDTDISLSVEGRKWVNCCGHLNFPDGEVFTGPVEDSVEGHIRFSFPGIFRGKAIEDIRLRFEKGKVVEASAAKGEDLLLQLLDIDEGARFVGEVAVGTNFGIDKFSKNMLFDEKIGGTVHLALGMSIPDSLGKNKSAIHWDMLCDMSEGGEIYADGELIYKDKKFII